MSRSTSRPATSRSPGPATRRSTRFARDALGDLNAFWAQAYPRFFAGPSRPWPAGTSRSTPGTCPRAPSRRRGSVAPARPRRAGRVSGNAFYDPRCDSIAYDRSLLQELPPTTAASSCRGHGPRVRARHAEPLRLRRLRAQHPGRDAGRLPGRFVDAWVKDGHARHVSIRAPELDDVVRGFLRLRDQVGSARQQSAHGSYFDRVSAFYEGFDKGVAPAATTSGRSAVHRGELQHVADAADPGNAPRPTSSLGRPDAAPVLDGRVRRRHSESFRAPTLTAFDRTGPAARDSGGGTAIWGTAARPRPSTTTAPTWSAAYRADRRLRRRRRAVGALRPGGPRAGGEIGDRAAATRSVVCLTGVHARGTRGPSRPRST